MTRIVTTTYRYKPPPKRKGRKLAEITGPAVVTTKKSRRTVLGREAAAEVKASPSLGGGADAGQSIRPSGGPGDIQPSTPPGKSSTPANDDRKSAIVTTTEKTVQHQREQQQMAKLMASAETKDLVDRMMLGRWPGNGPPKKPGERT